MQTQHREMDFQGTFQRHRCGVEVKSAPTGHRRKRMGVKCYDLHAQSAVEEQDNIGATP